MGVEPKLVLYQSKILVYWVAVSSRSCFWCPRTDSNRHCSRSKRAVSCQLDYRGVVSVLIIPHSEHNLNTFKTYNWWSYGESNPELLRARQPYSHFTIAPFVSYLEGPNVTKNESKPVDWARSNMVVPPGYDPGICPYEGLGLPTSLRNLYIKFGELR